MTVNVKNWQELKKPNALERKQGSDNKRKASFVAEPLERGFGMTLGNSLRRVLLSSLQGAAITSVQIDNVLHEFSSVAGVREDVTDIVLNLKGVSIKMEVEGPKRLEIRATGPGVVTAGDISETNGIEILNRDHVICHLDDGASVYMELTVEQGKGYVAADRNRPEDAPIDLISVDALFSPIKKVSYKVEPTREGQVLDYDKLTLTLETDGSLRPEDAIAYAAALAQEHFRFFVDFGKVPVMRDDAAAPAAAAGSLRDRLSQPIDDFALSVRSLNSLKNSNIRTLADLVQYPEEDLLKVKNVGEKALSEIAELLQREGLNFGMGFEETDGELRILRPGVAPMAQPSAGTGEI